MTTEAQKMRRKEEEAARQVLTLSKWLKRSLFVDWCVGWMIVRLVGLLIGWWVGGFVGWLVVGGDAYTLNPEP